jgi:hypothetical protein
MTSHTKLIVGTVAVAALAAAGAGFAAVALTSSSHANQSATTPFGQGIYGSGLGGGRLGGRGLGGGLGPGDGDFGNGLGRRGFFGGTSAAAAYLGLSASALQTQLQSGKTLADVAKAQGKTVAGLVAAMVASQKKRLQSAVANGMLTEAQAQQIESQMAQRLKDFVNGVRPQFGGGGFGGGGLGNANGASSGGLGNGNTGNGAGTGSFGSG